MRTLQNTATAKSTPRHPGRRRKQLTSSASRISSSAPSDRWGEPPDGQIHFSVLYFKTSGRSVLSPSHRTDSDHRSNAKTFEQVSPSSWHVTHQTERQETATTRPKFTNLLTWGNASPNHSVITSTDTRLADQSKEDDPPILLSSENRSRLCKHSLELPNLPPCPACHQVRASSWTIGLCKRTICDVLHGLFVAQSQSTQQPNL